MTPFEGQVGASALGPSWSRQLETKYGLRLTADLRAWLDQEVWRGPGGAEFNQALSPEQLLEPEPGLVWGGFMLPDTLPWIGNGYGDWLCIRVDERSEVSEIVHWSHAGGGWLPVGNNLPEALLYDSARQLLFPRMPEIVEPELGPTERYRFADWAKNWFRERDLLDVPSFWNEPSLQRLSSQDPLLILGERSLATFAVARDRVVRYLESPLKTRGDRSFASQLGVRWEPEFVRWLFDTRQVPRDRWSELESRTQTPIEQLLQQDWPSAEAIALKVVSVRSDLGWPFDLLGWAAERRGESAHAARWYARGLKASIFSDEATRLRTHWFAEGYGKFSASRLVELRAFLTSEDAADPYVRIYLDDDLETLRARVGTYWLSGGRESLRRQDWVRAYQCYYQAGWDLGWQTLQDFGEVLSGLSAAATAAGWTGRALIASLHQHNL